MRIPTLWVALFAAIVVTSSFDTTALGDGGGLVYLRIGVIADNGDPQDPSWNDTLRATWQSYLLAQSDINADPTAFGLPATARIYLDMFDLMETTGSYNGAAMLASLNAYDNGAIAILGTDGSGSTMAVAQVMGRLQMPQCSSWAGDDVLSDKQSYPYFFRTLSGASDDITYLLPVMQYFGWTQFSFIYADSGLGNAYASAISDLLITDTQWQVTSKFTNYLTVDSDSTVIAIAIDQMARSFADGTRVVWLAGNMDWMAVMMLYAYKAGLMRDDTDISTELLDMTSDPVLTQEILRGSFFGSSGNAQTPDADRWQQRLPTLDPTLFPSMNLPGVSNLDITYACVQALVAGWAKFLADGAARGDPDVSLENLAARMFNANFTPDVWNTGVDSPAGYLVFDQNGDMLPAGYQIFNYNNTDQVIIGTSTQSNYTPLSDPTFRDGTHVVPLTAVQRLPVNSTWKSFDALALLVISIIGIIATVVTTATIWMNRQHSVVKRASPAFSMLTLLGIVAGYCTIFPYIGIPTAKACVAQTWLPPVAFSLVYASIAVKSWRLYKIFHHPLLSKNLTVKTPELLFYVSIQLAIQAASLLAVFTLPNCFQPRPSHRDLLVVTRVQHAFEASLYGTNSLLMVFVLFLTWKNRAIDSSYNETSQIAAASWNFVALLAIGLPLVYLPALYSYQFIMRHVLLVLMTTFTLVILFGPALLQIAGIRANEVDLGEVNNLMRMTLDTSALSGASAAGTMSSSLVANSDDGGRALTYRLSNVTITKVELTENATMEVERTRGGHNGGGGGGEADDGGTCRPEEEAAAGTGADLILAFKERGKQKTTVRMSFRNQAEQAHWHTLLESAAAVSRSRTTSPTGSGLKDNNNNNKGSREQALRGVAPKSRDILKTATEV
ncbi:hypothetical protein HDU87_008394 [Geranomyces variabilis]|uniref:G-protein coupled receptors family 3 profile domain-containing protein n=1 Tax=Geranomyces variabilis TaxID=109894 RepID=A0AAD5TCN4_9FUNG|nr:hypothetical protein HDU87_008394 [Geranomyces variabilis]